jgi:hypothetical protein
MGSKTIFFNKKVERRTYVQGDFIGKYNGFLTKNQELNTLSKVYDIYIYEGQIFNVINQIENPESINETVYNTVKSHLLLEQKSFENVTSIPDSKIDNYDGFKLHIKEPKLEHVQIKNVLQEGDATFGTITCLVTGYIIDYIYEEDQIEIETCDDCYRPIEDCSCVAISDPPDVIFDIEEVPVHPMQKWYNDYGDSSPGCFIIGGLVLLVLFLISFGLPGLIIVAILALLYGIGNFPVLSNFFSKFFSWLGYAIIGLFVLGIFLVLTDKCSDNSNRSNQTYSKQDIHDSDSYKVPLDNGSKVLPTEEPVIEKKEIETYKSAERLIPKSKTAKSVYICNGKYAKRYHLSPYCRGLSNCKSTVSSISLEDVNASGKSLCGWED